MATGIVSLVAKVTAVAGHDRKHFVSIYGVTNTITNNSIPGAFKPPLNVHLNVKDIKCRFYLVQQGTGKLKQYAISGMKPVLMCTNWLDQYIKCYMKHGHELSSWG